MNPLTCNRPELSLYWINSEPLKTGLDRQKFYKLTIEYYRVNLKLKNIKNIHL